MSSNTPCSVMVVGVIPRPVGTGAARPLTVRCRLLERFRIGGGERGVQLGRRLRPPQPLADLDLAQQGGRPSGADARLYSITSPLPLRYSVFFSFCFLT